MAHKELPVPSHFDPQKVKEVWRVAYQTRAKEAQQWAKQHQIKPAAEDTFKICLILVDVQNTFCIPDFELYVGGRSGTGAVDDNRRLCEFIYRNLDVITQIVPTMDTHQPIQIFHSIFLINDQGEHPDPYTLISVEDIEQGVWRFNPAVAKSLNIDPEYGNRHLLYYTRKLRRTGKYELTIWPYHAMLGGIGHALVSSVEEAIFFHSIARQSQPNIQIKGNHPLTENYSVLGPEVTQGPDNDLLVEKNTRLIEHLLQFDAIVVAGQAKSHCVAWTVEDLLQEFLARDKKLPEKVYLLEDCTSPVVVPGVIDYTEQADSAFQRFADAGMHIVRSTEPMDSWPGLHF
ncbi:MAG: isochorismatase [Calditrichaeota bacterium]|nr:MAG: isochorismatase [Calditrichota bacterium]